MNLNNGILLIDKEKGITSRDVVNKAIKILNTKKIGHTGTLDPLATGVLVLCIGNATKLVEMLTSLNKEYIAEFTFGIKTDTLDITGTTLEEKDSIIDRKKIEEAIKKIIGTYEQTIPIYSAVKVNGKKLYEYARENTYVELPKRKVNISSMELLDYKIVDNKTIIKIKTTVSKGTYIRAIANDLAEKLNTIGIMSSLRRTKQGNFKIEDCISIDDISSDKIIKIKDILKEYKQVTLTENEYKNIKDGQIIDNIYNTDTVIFIYNDDVKAIYKTYDKDNTKLKPYKMF